MNALIDPFENPLLPPREISVTLPTLHSGQMLCYEKLRGLRYGAARCGRRFGKSTLAETLAEDRALAAQTVGYFAPTYKLLYPCWDAIANVLDPVRAPGTDKSRGEFKTINRGQIDFWTMEDENSGRGRAYDLVIIDEAAFAKDNAMTVWERAIKPTLLDRAGCALVVSNTNGAVPDQFFYEICTDPKYGFAEFHAPSMLNPLLPRGPGSDLDTWPNTMHPLVYQQEILAEFVDWSGAAFFSLDKLLVGNAGVPVPVSVDYVFAVIDTAVKDKTTNDGQAVIYFAYNRASLSPLTILDWEILQMEGSLLEQWLPTVFQNLEHLARATHARRGSVGAFIEDKVSGSILIQQAQRRGWPAHPIEEKLTALGKDERALNVSGHHFHARCKITADAYAKVMVYKEKSANHLVTQVTHFRIGDKDAAKRADDLLDCYTYGLALALGDSEGIG